MKLNKKKLLIALGTAAVAAGAVYGVPPEYSRPLLEGLCKGIGWC